MRCDADIIYSTFGDAAPGLCNSHPSHLKEVDLSYNRFRRSLRVFVWMVGPRHSVNYFNCAV